MHIIAGLEIVNTNSAAPVPYNIQPISFSEGKEVRVGGVPKFKLVYDSPGPVIAVNPVLLFLPLPYSLSADLSFCTPSRLSNVSG